ncbi:PIN domain nuclease of toxin-antitoxin system [Micromonospora vinacea]|uniref:PIN domain nuclease of toxin-antitoxin system n=1 Tax=Micromonospora vinacea TaxID=709878 RepID=A0ABS0KC23_9ACTN|nr:PIN domain nuclease of toxin-antitoxin system [Micromonospora vinacea]
MTPNCGNSRSATITPSWLVGYRAIHRDPFDRMLVAQALHEGLTLVTRDDRIQKYDVPILVA